MDTVTKAVIDRMYRERLIDYLEEAKDWYTSETKSYLHSSTNKLHITVNILYENQYEWLEDNYPELIIKYMDTQ